MMRAHKIVGSDRRGVCGEAAPTVNRCYVRSCRPHEPRRREVNGCYSAREVCRIVGCTYRQLDYWDRIGLVSPSVASARGSGTARRYSDSDLILMAAAERLARLAIHDLSMVVKVIAELRSRPDLLDAVVILNGETGRHALTTTECAVAVVLRTAPIAAALGLVAEVAS